MGAMKISCSSLVLIVFVSASTLATLAISPRQAENDGAETWGGPHISMEMTAQGATLQFDCARGTIQQAIKPDASGEFTVSGTYTPERGGPIQKNNPPRELPATYKGRIQGDSMQLEIVLADKDQQPEPFALTRGKSGRVVRCY